jgi:hypothetical protein
MTAVSPEASRQAAVEAALLVLERMGLSPADLAVEPDRRALGRPAPGRADTVGDPGSDGVRQDPRGGPPQRPRRPRRRGAPGGGAALPVPARRGGRTIAEADNPARKVAKPHRLPSTRRAVPDTRLAEINQAAATTGDDPALDTLLLRLHTETACRRGALALRPDDLDPDQCLIRLQEKGEAIRWQPISPTLRCVARQRSSTTGCAPDDLTCSRRTLKSGATYHKSTGQGDFAAMPDW